MKLPLPTSKSARWLTSTQPNPVSPPPTNPPVHYQPMRRSRTTSQGARETVQQQDGAEHELATATSRPNDDNKEHDRGPTWNETAAVDPSRPRTGGLREVWEEQSNIHSLFSDSESRSMSEKPNRYQDHQPNGRDIQRSLQHERNGHRPSESLPPFKFVDVDKNGLLQVEISEPKLFGTTRLMPSAPRISTQPVTRPVDPFRGSSEEEVSPSPQPKKGHAVLRSKLAVRNGDEAKRPYVERAVYPLDQVMKTSAEYYDSPADAAVSQRKLKKKDQDLNNKRSTLFQDVDDHMTDEDMMSDIPSQGDEVEQQPTPKAARQQVAPPAPKAAPIQKVQKPVAAQMPPKPVAPQKTTLQESPIPRTNTVPGTSSSRKRRHSVDYDDAALQEMNYSDLKLEPFDHDPARLAVQSPARPSPDNLDDRIQYFKTKDENSQHHFFTEVSVREWEDCGDWFLEQFGRTVQKMKEARQAKRKMVEQYETEVSTREEAVRKKKDHLERKLSKLRNDGESMLKGKDADD